MKMKVVGITNALVDHIADVDDKFLNQLGLEKGIANNSSLVDMKEVERLLNGRIIKSAGGSPANTIAGLGTLGLDAICCGCIGDDANGSTFYEEMQKRGVDAKLQVIEGGSTGTIICLVSPDKERTMIVNGGVSNDYDKSDLPEEDIKGAQIIHTSAYEFIDMPEPVLRAYEIARQNNVITSFDMADPLYVANNKRKIENFMLQYVDIAFANEEEAIEFTGERVENAVINIADYCEITVVKLGKKGSMILDRLENDLYEIPIYEADVVDTTGAGDAYAAGFLYGFATKKDIRTCGRLGSFYASKVVSQKGGQLNHNPIGEFNV